MAISRMQEPRQLYGLGSLVKKITRPIKKIAKSPIGKAALMAGIGFGIPGTSFGGLFGRASFGGAAKGLFSKSGGLGGLIKRGMFKGNVHKDPGFLRNIFGKFGGGKGLLGIGAASGLLGGLFAKGADETEEEYQDRIVRLQPYLRQYYGNVGDTFGDQKMGPNELEDFVTSQSIEYQGAKDGGIIGYKDGGSITFKEFLEMREKEDKQRSRDMLFKDYEEFKRRQKIQEQKTMAAEGGIIGAEVDEMKVGPKGEEETMEEEVVEQDDMSEPMTGIEKVADTLRDIAMVLYKVNPTIMPYKMAKAMYDRLPDISKQHVDDTGRRMTEPEEDETTGSPDSMSETMIMVEGKKDGGIMNLGGKEMDLRGGGFVPLGKKERADDVPARLSKNEFVFTADAVRAAGGGSVQKGAQKMYDTMKMLEKRIK